MNPYLGVPSRSIFARLAALDEARRDATFQKEHAPTIASRWVDRLQLTAGGGTLAADFTLASRYQFNGEVRVDFTVAAPVGVTRETLSQILVQATDDLPPGSVANVRGLTYAYQTDQFERRVQGAQGQGDLVLPETGAKDPLGATLGLPPDAWERQDVRKEMKNAVYSFIEHLNEHVEHYHKCIWWNLDRDRLFMMIDGFYAPGTDGLSVASVVERDPIAIVGNSLVFRVAAGSFLGIGDLKTPAELRNYYVVRDAPTDPMLVSLPTDGLYAQTVMDECAAVEEHFGSTDWVLSDPDPDLGSIAPELLATRRAEPGGTAPTAFPQTIINLQNAPGMPPPSGLADALSAAANPNAFRDMAGLAGTQANAASAFQTAATLASTFGQQAAALKLAEIAAKAQATQSADQKLASVQRAQDKQLIGADEAQRQAAKILEEMNAPSTTTKPHQDRTMMEAARAAMGQPGSLIETTTGDGTFKVELAGFPTPNGGGGGASVVDPFPTAPYALTFDTSDAKLNAAMAAIAAKASLKKMCAAVVDLTGNPTNPPYAGLNDDDLLYTGSLPKILPYYAAFELRHRVRRQVAAAIAAGLATSGAGWERAVIRDLETAWRPQLDARFPGLAKGFPKLADIFSFSATGAVDFKTSGTSQPDLDAIGQGPVAGLGFLECLKLAMQWSSPHAASRLVLDVGYPFLNGTLRSAGFFQPKTATAPAAGLWLSADYRGNDWPNASQPLTPRWAKAQKLPSRPDGKSNIVSTARSVARLLALLGLDRLVDATTSQAMRSTAAPGDQVGRRVQRALDGAGIAHTALFSKGGRGDDARNHDCAIIERTLASGTTIRYAVVGLGSDPDVDKDLAALFVELDAAVASLH